MERAAHLSSLRRDANALLAAGSLGLERDVPSCPGWTVERLVGHVGRVYRWTAGWVTNGHAPEVERPPAGEAVTGWTADGLDVILPALEGLDPSGRVATWAGVQPATFWPRRMAIETALHRWDGQAAQSIAEPIDATLAVDALDEVFDVIFPVALAPGALTGAGETLHLHATDASGEWLLTLGESAPRVERTHAKGDVAARGTASDLLLLVWNRVGPDAVQVFGDVDLLRRVCDAFRF